MAYWWVVVSFSSRGYSFAPRGAVVGFSPLLPLLSELSELSGEPGAVVIEATDLNHKIRLAKQPSDLLNPGAFRKDEINVGSIAKFDYWLATETAGDGCSEVDVIGGEVSTH